ncbi:MAG: hypothetical protein PVJ86_12025 [Phycisphaerales bacterium]|jgi:hypothetical protein
MINGKIDNKNIGLAKNLWRLRQALDVHCLISANWDAIKKMGWKNFFGFLEMSYQHLIVLYICKVFEKETDKQGKVKYDLDSIEGVLRAIDNEKAAVLHSTSIRDFAQEYGGDSDKDGLASVSSVVEKFRKEHNEALSRFRTLRDKWVAHGESEFNPKDAPSYDIMERLFNFGLDFYVLVSEAFISVGPADLNRDRKVKMSLKRMLRELGLEEIKTEME